MDAFQRPLFLFSLMVSPLNPFDLSEESGLPFISLLFVVAINKLTHRLQSELQHSNLSRVTQG